MTTSQPQPARDTLGRLATPEHLLSVVTQLADKWRKHASGAATAVTGEHRSMEFGMAAAYCQSLAILLDQPYNVVRESLEAGVL